MPNKTTKTQAANRASEVTINATSTFPTKKKRTTKQMKVNCRIGWLDLTFQQIQRSEFKARSD